MSFDGILPRETAARVDAELRPGERIVWVGQPIPGRFARKSIGIVLFGIPCTAISVFWMIAAASMSTQDRDGAQGFFDFFFPLCGLPFLLLGMAMLSSPCWLRRKARRTAYVITDQRALILHPRGWRRLALRSFDPEHLTTLRRRQNRDGSGDVIFARKWISDPESNRFAHIGFFAIANVKDVENHIRELKAKTNPQCVERRKILRDYFRKLGPALQQRHGPRVHYAPSQVLGTASDLGLSATYISYGYALYCRRADFDASHPQAGEHGHYDAMRSEIYSEHYGSGSTDDSSSVADENSSIEYSDTDSWTDSGGYSDGGSDSGGGDGGGGSDGGGGGGGTD